MIAPMAKMSVRASISATRAAVDLSAFPSHEVTVRGRDDALVIRAVADARDLPEPAVAAGAPPEAAKRI